MPEGDNFKVIDCKLESMKSDQNLLFCVIALQMDFIQREEFVSATSVWLLDKSLSIEEILIQQGAISQNECDLLRPLVERHIANHDNDAQKSLAALSGISSFVDELKSIKDEKLDATISLITDHLHPSGGSKTSRSSSSGLAESPKGGRSKDAPRYQILRPLAKGGLGEVYIANDSELNREVALKEIQAKFADNENSRLRFMLEAEVTGGLEHPGIVPIYGLGQYDDGRPFYAMRFIKGDSLKEASDRFHDRSQETDQSPNTATKDLDPAENATTHLDKTKVQSGNSVSNEKSEAGSIETSPNSAAYNGVEFRKLLGRFVDVCQAIEYAHSRGVLHRDLKPGNIMLGKYGETLVVDWGLAKAKTRDESNKTEDETTLVPRSSSGSSHTMLGSAIGTPAFMPPEQAAGRLEELGPSSDVYSLGATLYYMLTGKSPFKADSVDHLLEHVKRGEFEAPVLVNRSIPKPLSAICVKAMATAQTDRYHSTTELAEDIERWMADEPVAIYREPLLKRISRWAQRNRILVSNVAAALAVGIVALIVSAILLKSANNKLAAANQVINEEVEKVRKAQETAMAINSFLTDDLLSQANPEQNAYGDKTTVVQLLDRAAKEIDENDSLDGQPNIESSIRLTIGQTYYALGRFRQAITHLERALALKRALPDVDPKEIIEILHGLAQCNLSLDRTTEAESQIEELIESTERHLDPDDETLSQAKILKSSLLLQKADYEAAEALADETLTDTIKRHGLETDITNQCRVHLANVLALTLKDYDRARKLHEESLNYLIKSGKSEDSAEVMVAKAQLAEALGSYGKVEESKALMLSVVAAQESRLPRDHPLAVNHRIGLGVILAALHEYAPAARHLKESLEMAESTLGPNHPITWFAREQNSSLLVTISQFSPDKKSYLSKAEKLSRQNLETCETRGWNELNTNGFLTRWNLATVFNQQGKSKEARELIESTLGVLKDAGREQSVPAFTLGIALAESGGSKFAKESEPKMEKLMASAKEKLPPLHNMIGYGSGTLGFIKLSLKQHEEAEKLFLDLYNYCENSEQAPFGIREKGLEALAIVSQSTSKIRPLAKTKLEKGKPFKIRLSIPGQLATLQIAQGFSRTVEFNRVKKDEAILYFMPNSFSPEYNLSVIPLGGDLDGKSYELEISQGEMQEIASIDGKIDDQSSRDVLQLDHPRETHSLLLEKGAFYQFDVISEEMAVLVRLETDEERFLKTDKSARVGRGARIVFSPKKTGTFQLVVMGTKLESRGSYKITATKFDPVGEPRIKKGEFKKVDSN